MVRGESSIIRFSAICNAYDSTFESCTPIFFFFNILITNITKDPSIPSLAYVENENQTQLIVRNQQQLHITIQAVNSIGTLRTEGGDSFIIYIGGVFADNVTIIIEYTITDNLDGTYSLIFTPTIPGTYTLQISLYTIQIYGSPFVVEVQGTIASYSFAFGGFLGGSVIAGESSTVYIQSVKNDGTNMTLDGDKYSVILFG